MITGLIRLPEVRGETAGPIECLSPPGQNDSGEVSCSDCQLPPPYQRPLIRSSDVSADKTSAFGCNTYALALCGLSTGAVAFEVKVD